LPRAKRKNAPKEEPGIKAQIVKVATRLFALHGYSATSLQAIVDEVGIRKPSLLYHFSSKEVLREAVIQEMLAQWHARLPRIMKAAAVGGDSIDALFGEVREYFNEDPNRARLLLREAVNRPDAIRSRLADDFGPWMSLLSKAIADGQRAGSVRADLDPQAWLVQILIMVISTYATGSVWATTFPDGAEGSFDRQISEIVRMAKTSLFPDRPKAPRNPGSAGQENPKNG
tara:strand:+ start:165 stop:851 length:687 start_codon:yes stop_codon:yes gene_type:complete